MSVSELAIAKIDPSPMNPRKTFDQVELEDLAADIKLRGVLQNVVVRKKAGGRLELVVGERRYRASKIAGLDKIPGAVVELDDKEALETMIVENAKRADVNPIEEADAYKALLETHAMTVDDIATRVGRSRSAVYGRLKLVELCDAGRKAMAEGTLSPSVALLVARVPSPKLQKEAVKSVLGNQWSGPMSARQAAKHIQERYMLRLSQAPWKQDDADLVAVAGACSVCPHRTGNQSELFDDVKSADVCTMPPCFEKKRKAYAKRRSGELKKAGASVLTSKVAKGVLYVWKRPISGTEVRLLYDAPYVMLDSKCEADPHKRTYRALIKPDPAEVVVATVSGETAELLPKNGLTKKLKDAGHNFAQKKSKAVLSWERTRARSKASDALGAEVDRRCFQLLLTKGATTSLTANARLARFLILTLVDRAWSDAEHLCQVLDIKSKKHHHGLDLKKWVKHPKRTLVELSVLALAMAADAGSMAEAGELFGFDPKVIEKQVRADAKALAAAERKASPKKKAPKRSRKKTTSKRKAVAK